MEKSNAAYTGETAVFLEVDGTQYDLAQVMERAKKDCRAKSKKRIENIKLYVKPEDGKAYYTANNEKYSGSVDL
ncbi:MAG: hypothetical protein IK115_03720 [Lachnospiraceae bacterium]|nr:hypothetical protein [Lachnospiraceae bacterium]